jgi:hypothetical protein
MDQADDVVQRVLICGQAAPSAFDERVERVAEIGVGLHGDNVGPRHHHLVDAPGAQVEDRADHLALLGLDDALFAGIGTAGSPDSTAFKLDGTALDANDRIIYDATTGALYYDADGSGAAAAVQFAQLTPGTVLTVSDFLVI